jgi:hypothetical protein
VLIGQIEILPKIYGVRSLAIEPILQGKRSDLLSLIVGIDKRQWLMESETTQLAPANAMQIALPAQLK